VTQVQKRFIQNLRKARYSLDLTQMRLAENAGISTGFIGDIEAGKKFPSAITIQKLCDALELEPHELFLPEGDSPNDTGT
jgi:transcriptional regulator with XRE-family HTH domain